MLAVKKKKTYLKIWRSKSGIKNVPGKFTYLFLINYVFYSGVDTVLNQSPFKIIRDMIIWKSAILSRYTSVSHRSLNGTEPVGFPTISLESTWCKRILKAAEHRVSTLISLINAISSSATIGNAALNKSANSKLTFKLRCNNV